MRKTGKRWIVPGLIALLVIAALPGALWLGLTYQPKFFRDRAALPREQRQRQARHFTAQTSQLVNDIKNEPRWEAAFTDQEVNAWLAEDLVTHFADQIPAGISSPCIKFDMDLVTIAFELDQGPVPAVITIELRVRVPEENSVALTVEKIHAGALPFSADRFIGRITRHARRQGLEIEWSRDAEGLPVALLHYTPAVGRRDVILERLQIREGRIDLAGRSDRMRGRAFVPTLPDRQVLQSTFPRRKVQPHGGPAPRPRRSSTSPTTY